MKGIEKHSHRMICQVVMIVIVLASMFSLVTSVGASSQKQGDIVIRIYEDKDTSGEEEGHKVNPDVSPNPTPSRPQTNQTGKEELEGIEKSEVLEVLPSGMVEIRDPSLPNNGKKLPATGSSDQLAYSLLVFSGLLLIASYYIRKKQARQM